MPSVQFMHQFSKDHKLTREDENFVKLQFSLSKFNFAYYNRCSEWIYILPTEATAIKIHKIRSGRWSLYFCKLTREWNLRIDTFSEPNLIEFFVNLLLDLRMVKQLKERHHHWAGSCLHSGDEKVQHGAQYGDAPQLAAEARVNVVLQRKNHFL